MPFPGIGRGGSGYTVSIWNALTATRPSATAVDDTMSPSKRYPMWPPKFTPTCGSVTVPRLNRLTPPDSMWTPPVLTSHPVYEFGPLVRVELVADRAGCARRFVALRADPTSGAPSEHRGVRPGARIDSDVPDDAAGVDGDGGADWRRAEAADGQDRRGGERCRRSDWRHGGVARAFVDSLQVGAGTRRLRCWTARPPIGTLLACLELGTSEPIGDDEPDDGRHPDNWKGRATVSSHFGL